MLKEKERKGNGIKTKRGSKINTIGFQNPFLHNFNGVSYLKSLSQNPPFFLLPLPISRSLKPQNNHPQFHHHSATARARATTHIHRPIHWRQQQQLCRWPRPPHLRHLLLLPLLRRRPVRQVRYHSVHSISGSDSTFSSGNSCFQELSVE